MKNLMSSELANKYFVFAQFCTELSADKLISPPGEIERTKQYFFPNLLEHPAFSLVMTSNLHNSLLGA